MRKSLSFVLLGISFLCAEPSTVEAPNPNCSCSTGEIWVKYSSKEVRNFGNANIPNATTAWRQIGTCVVVVL